MVEDSIRMAFPRRIWVTGRVAASRTTGDGDRVFHLIEQRELHEELALPCVLQVDVAEDIDGSLDRLHDAAIEDLIVDGHLLRAGGLLSYDFTTHRLTFSVTALDPEATAGGLADVRAATADLVRAEALSGRQRSLSTAVAPLRIAVVGPRGDEAVEDACRALERSDYDVELTVYEPNVRGNDAVEQLAAAMRRAATSRHDLVLLVRAAGRPLGMAAFDSEPVVRAIAASDVPVITGIGDADHRTVSDVVAHQAHRTAEAAVEAVLARLQRAASSLDVALADVHHEADAGRRRATQQLVAARSEVHEAALRARIRAAEATKRRRMWIRSVGAVLVIALIVLAALVSVWFAIGAAVVVVAVAAEQFAGPLRAARKGRAPVADVTFAEVLERLGRIRGQLEATSSPEEVLRLEEEAEGLAQRGRVVLERRVGQRAAQRSAHPDVQDDWPPASQQEDQGTPAVHPSWPGSVEDVERPTEVVTRRQPQDDAQTEVVAREPEADEGTPTQVVDLTDSGAASAQSKAESSESSAQPAERGDEPAAESREDASAPAARQHPASNEQPTEVFRTAD
jgi:exodeoxyribonuclease VII large subunit